MRERGGPAPALSLLPLSPNPHSPHHSTPLPPLLSRPPQALTTALNFLVVALTTQFFLAGLCGLRWGIYLLFAAFIACSLAVVVLFLPETRGVPLEEMPGLWARHWWWGRKAAGKGRVEVGGAKEAGAC